MERERKEREKERKEREKERKEREGERKEREKGCAVESRRLEVVRIRGRGEREVVAFVQKKVVAAAVGFVRRHGKDGEGWFVRKHGKDEVVVFVRRHGEDGQGKGWGREIEGWGGRSRCRANCRQIRGGWNV